MNILLISGKYMPIYNKEGRGAIQKLERIYLEYNEKIGDNFTVYSPMISADNYDSKKMKKSVFRNIDLTSARAKILKKIYSVKNILSGAGNNEYYIREIIKDIKKRGEENKFDLIIFENEERSIPVFKKKTRTNTRIVLHLHNDYINVDKKHSKKVLENCDKVWCVSKFIEKRVKEVLDIKTVVIPNTYEKMPSPSLHEIEKLKKEYKPEDNTIFLYIGRLLKVKGIYELVKAFKTYNASHPNSKLIIIGDFGTGRKERRFARLMTSKFLKDPNIDSVGYKRSSDIVNYYALAKAQIIPSKWNEAFGLVTLEAMQGNVRIIASGFGAFREICGGKALYVSKDKMVDDLVKAMEKINSLKKLPKKYYKNILCNYSKDIYCSRISKEIRNA